jgi:hypothetical protein
MKPDPYKAKFRHLQVDAYKKVILAFISIVSSINSKITILVVPMIRMENKLYYLPVWLYEMRVKITSSISELASKFKVHPTQITN